MTESEHETILFAKCRRCTSLHLLWISVWWSLKRFFNFLIWFPFLWLSSTCCMCISAVHFRCSLHICSADQVSVVTPLMKLNKDDFICLLLLLFHHWIHGYFVLLPSCQGCIRLSSSRFIAGSSLEEITGLSLDHALASLPWTVSSICNMHCVEFQSQS